MVVQVELASSVEHHLMSVEFDTELLDALDSGVMSILLVHVVAPYELTKHDSASQVSSSACHPQALLEKVVYDPNAAIVLGFWSGEFSDWVIRDSHVETFGHKKLHISGLETAYHNTQRDARKSGVSQPRALFDGERNHVCPVFSTRGV